MRRGARMVRRRVAQRAGGALHPGGQRPLGTCRGETGVHRDGAVRGVRRRAVVRRVALGPAVWLSVYSTTDRGSTSGSLSAASQARMLRRRAAWLVGAGREDE